MVSKETTVLLNISQCIGVGGQGVYWDCHRHDAVGSILGSSGFGRRSPFGMYYNVGPPFTIAKLVQITPITMVYGTYNYT